MLGDPIIIERTRPCEFKGMTIPWGTKTRKVCKTCGYARSNVIHHAFPRSTREWGSGSHHQAYQTDNAAWKSVLTPLLEATSLMKGEWVDEGKDRRWVGLTRVVVEAEFTWGRHYSVDQDNFRYPISKFLGDTLQSASYIANDGWDKERGFWTFSFGELSYNYEPGAYRMVLSIFAMDD